MRVISNRSLRKRRITFVVALTLVLFSVISLESLMVNDTTPRSVTNGQVSEVLSDATISSPLAREELEKIAVKGRAPKTGYARSEFGDGWARIGGCDMRNVMLGRYLTDKQTDEQGCIVFSGVLNDLYTGKLIQFSRGAETSDDIQIDHVVALSDAWQKGAQGLTYEQRVQFANDPLNLIPVDGATNQKKGDSDAASWLPPNKQYRCQYVARQIAVKAKYKLWVTEAEKVAMIRVLNGCGEQRVPVETQTNP